GGSVKVFAILQRLAVSIDEVGQIIGIGIGHAWHRRKNEVSAGSDPTPAIVPEAGRRFNSHHGDSSFAKAHFPCGIIFTHTGPPTSTGFPTAVSSPVLGSMRNTIRLSES